MRVYRSLSLEMVVCVCAWLIFHSCCTLFLFSIDSNSTKYLHEQTLYFLYMLAKDTYFIIYLRLCTLVKQRYSFFSAPPIFRKSKTVHFLSLFCLGMSVCVPKIWKIKSIWPKHTQNWIVEPAINLVFSDSLECNFSLLQTSYYYYHPFCFIYSAANTMLHNQIFCCCYSL